MAGGSGRQWLRRRAAGDEGVADADLGDQGAGLVGALGEVAAVGRPVELDVAVGQGARRQGGRGRRDGPSGGRRSAAGTAAQRSRSSRRTRPASRHSRGGSAGAAWTISSRARSRSWLRAARSSAAWAWRGGPISADGLGEAAGLGGGGDTAGGRLEVATGGVAVPPGAGRKDGHEAERGQGGLQAGEDHGSRAVARRPVRQIAVAGERRSGTERWHDGISPRRARRYRGGRPAGLGPRGRVRIRGSRRQPALRGLSWFRARPWSGHRRRHFAVVLVGRQVRRREAF